MNRRRLTAEEVRDSILFVSGKLNLERGGPGYRDFEYTDRYAPIYKYITADQPELWKRTVYRFTVRSVSNPFLDVLDCPNPSNLTPVRNRTTTALQALALLNNEFVLKQAEYFVQRVDKEVGSDTAAQVQRAFQLALQREPDPQERESSLTLVEEHSLFSLCRVLFNSSEFIYVD